MNAMSALYHIAQNDSPTLNTSNNSTTPNTTSNSSDSKQASSDLSEQAQIVPQWSENFKNFIELCLKKQPVNRPSASELLLHKFILSLSDRKALIDLIRKTKEIVRDLDNLQYRKIKKIIMVEGSNNSSNSVLSSSLNNNDQLNEHVGGSESGGSSLLNLKNDGSESSQLEDASSSHLEYEDDVENENDENESTSMIENNIDRLNSISDNDNELAENISTSSSLCIQQIISATNQLNFSGNNIKLSENGSSIKPSPSSSKIFSIGQVSSPTVNSNNKQKERSPPSSTPFSSSLTSNNKELINFGDSLKRRVSSFKIVCT